MENPRGPNAGALLLLPQGRDCAARGAMGPQPRHRQPAPRQGGAGTLARPSRPARAPDATPPPREPGGRRLRPSAIFSAESAQSRQMFTQRPSKDTLISMFPSTQAALNTNSFTGPCIHSLMKMCFSFTPRRSLGLLSSSSNRRAAQGPSKVLPHEAGCRQNLCMPAWA